MLFPRSVDELSPALLTEALQQCQPGIEVTDFDIPQLSQCGSGKASTADRVILKLRYGGRVPPDMPEQVMLKTTLLAPGAPNEMYENEVRFYRDIRPELSIETPRVFASDFDASTGQFGVIMEDLNLRYVRFPNAAEKVTVEELRGLLRTLAALHGSYWQSPRLERDLSWVATPVKGGMGDWFQQVGYDLVKDQVDKHEFKQELIAPLGITLETMWERLCRFQHESLDQPQTLLHGDTHIANTYLVPGGDGGLFDWQLLVRGLWAHDVSYVIATGLTTDQRRQNERDLLAYYLEQLRAQNLENVPSIDEAWYLYRRSVMWGLFIGWLITPPANYGEVITVANIEKLVSAVADLDSFSE